MGHKLAVRPIRKGENVRKYGQIIGQATEAIEAGQWVHSHNLVNGDFVRDYASASAVPPPPQPITDRTFLGYKRPGGKSGTRNYLAVISTVNCSATVSRYIAQRFDKSSLRDFPNIDGVIAVKHGGGCGIQYKGLQHEVLNRTLAGMARSKNGSSPSPFIVTSQSYGRLRTATRITGRCPATAPMVATTTSLRSRR